MRDSKVPEVLVELNTVIKTCSVSSFQIQEGTGGIVTVKNSKVLS